MTAAIAVRIVSRGQKLSDRGIGEAVRAAGASPGEETKP
jgi:hypothetical protein